MPANLPYDALRTAFRDAVLRYQGALSGPERSAIMNGDTPAGPLGEYVATVRDHAYRVTDAQIAALSGAGLSEDAIFEATVSAAVGASLWRLDKVYAAVEAADAAS